MIKVVASLYPGGSRLDERWLATITIYSTDDGKWHKWEVSFGDRVIDGAIRKRKSAHQNLMHVLHEILSDDRIAMLPLDHIERGGKK